MVVVGLLNAYGSTVGDNLEHHLVAWEIQKRGHRVKHLWNFKRQSPKLVRACAGLVAGCGGILWKGSPLRDYFFINTIMLARRCIGVSIGYNQGEPLGPRWIRAVNHMDLVAARDPWTLKWVSARCRTPVRCYPSVSWLYKPPLSRVQHAGKPLFDLGLILNRRAFEINVGTGDPWKLYPGLKGLRCLEIPFAQPIEQPFTPCVNNPAKMASIASAQILKCRAVYTQRLHGFILALLNGVPAVCHGGGFKVQSQADMCGYPLLRTFKQLRALNPQGWLSMINDNEQLDLDPYVQHMRSDAEGHVKGLDAWLKTL